MAKRNAAPPYQEKLGKMYSRYILDSVIELAYEVSKDFSSRLELYQDVDNKLAQSMSQLQSLYGFSELFPNYEIRRKLYLPIFGNHYHGAMNSGSASQETNSQVTSQHPFSKTLRHLLVAAKAFSENAQPTGFPGLRERIRSAIRPFKNHLEDMKGIAWEETDRRLKEVFESSVNILKEEKVKGVFGILRPLEQDWPIEVSPSTEGAKLIERVSNQLSSDKVGVITRDKFIRMQRIAQKGQESIESIFNPEIENNNDLLDTLTAKLYAWGSELGVLSQSESGL